MFGIDLLNRVERALATPFGWIELAVIALALSIAWLVDHRVRLRTEHRHGMLHVGMGSVNRVIFPLTALGFALLGRLLFQHFSPSFFLNLAVPLLLSLALIRIAVYVLRNLFKPSGWLNTSERVLSYSIWLALILYFLGILQETVKLMEQAEFSVGKHQFSLWQMVSGVFLIAITILASLWLSRLLEAKLMEKTHLDMSLRVVLGKFFHALFLLIGVLFALSAVGIDLTALSIFGGALGVGIGLGLQKIASNYIAGFTILLDRSIRLGDLITADNRSGVVTQLTARYVVVRGADGVATIIPNDILVINTVLNHSYGGKETRLALPVQISYDSDLEFAIRILEEVGRAHPRALSGEHAPKAALVRFADHGIDLELGVWINDPEQGQLNIRSEINLAIWRAFREHGIRIPYPQREVRLLQ